jgi:hypothetical protein
MKYTKNTGQQPDLDGDDTIDIVFGDGTIYYDDTPDGYEWDLEVDIKDRIIMWRIHDDAWTENVSGVIPAELEHETKITAVFGNGDEYTTNAGSFGWSRDTNKLRDYELIEWKFAGAKEAKALPEWQRHTKDSNPAGTHKVLVRMKSGNVNEEVRTATNYRWTQTKSTGDITHYVIVDGLGAKSLSELRKIGADLGAPQRALHNGVGVVVHDMDYEGQVLHGRYSEAKTKFVMENGDEYSYDVLYEKGAQFIG